MKVGTDIVAVGRFIDKVDNKAFLNRIFTQKEIEHIFLLKDKQKQAERMAGKFSGKEAFAKALGTGISDGVDFSEIEILPDKNGAPHVELSGKTKQVFSKFDEKNIEMSVSHAAEFAISICIIF